MGTYKNELLAALSATDIHRLAPHLSPVVFKRNLTLHNPGETVDTVYFLEEGICSVVVTMQDGATVEVGILGRDGFVGAPALLGTDHSPNHSFIQIPGHGYSIKASVLLQQSETSAALLSMLQRSIQGLMVQTAQTAACNRVHDLPERLARWLLMCRERVGADRLDITQEFLAMMLGTRRTTVTVAAGVLQKAGLIAYTRGHVTIKDHAGLKKAACECYGIVHDEYVRLGLLQGPRKRRR
ncbi:MAG: Crp/Fnr family transcriptional regulator [Acidobacteriaceae bacterium]